MNEGAFVVFLLALVAHCECFQFTANVTITEDASMPGASVQATMYYLFSESTVNHYMRLDFSEPTELSVLSDFGAQSRFQFCGSGCEAEFDATPIDELFFKAEDNRTAEEDFDQCACYTRAAGSVLKYWVHANDTSILCKAIVGGNAGKTMTFNTFSASLPPGVFDAPSASWSCPVEPLCRQAMDVVFVLDESGSVAASSWLTMKSFFQDLTNRFDVSESTAKFGIVLFSTNGRVVLPLSASKSEVIGSLESMLQVKASTCIGCGISLAVGNVLASSSRPSSAEPVIVLITDGFNAQPTPDPAANLSASAQMITDNGVRAIVVGVGDMYNRSELLQISPTLFEVDSFTNLSLFFDVVLTALCQGPPTMLCDDNCKGFCGCSHACFCPECEYINECSLQICSFPSTGCQRIEKVCADGDLCTIDSCDNATGCVYANKSCDGGSPCYSYSCDSALGCIDTYLCEDGEVCDNTTGCIEVSSSSSSSSSSSKSTATSSSSAVVVIETGSGGGSTGEVAAEVAQLLGVDVGQISVVEITPGTFEVTTINLEVAQQLVDLITQCMETGAS